MILKTLLNFFNMDNWESGQFAKTDESLRYDYEDNMNDEANALGVKLWNRDKLVEMINSIKH